MQDKLQRTRKQVMQLKYLETRKKHVREAAGKQAGKCAIMKTSVSSKSMQESRKECMEEPSYDLGRKYTKVAKNQANTYERKVEIYNQKKSYVRKLAKE